MSEERISGTTNDAQAFVALANVEHDRRFDVWLAEPQPSLQVSPWVYSEGGGERFVYFLGQRVWSSEEGEEFSSEEALEEALEIARNAMCWIGPEFDSERSRQIAGLESSGE